MAEHRVRYYPPDLQCAICEEAVVRGQRVHAFPFWNASIPLSVDMEKKTVALNGIEGVLLIHLDCFDLSLSEFYGRLKQTIEAAIRYFNSHEVGYAGDDQF